MHMGVCYVFRSGTAERKVWGEGWSEPTYLTERVRLKQHEGGEEDYLTRLSQGWV